jgi:hypothetical protein
MLLKSGKNPKFPQHLRPISLLSTTGKLFQKVILKIVQDTLKKKAFLMKASLVSAPVTTWHFNEAYVTLNFNNNMYTAAVFLDIEKAFDKTRHLGLLYKLRELNFSIWLIKLIISFLSQRKFRVSVEGELSTPRDIQAGMPQASVLSPTLYSLYINDTLQTPGVYLGLFADHTCIYATNRKGSYVLRKL